MEMSRTMMLHSAIHWPEVAEATLWPMSVRLATYIYNRVRRNDSELCPNDLWTRLHSSISELHGIQVFGCPVYVLDKKLSGGMKIPQWKAWTEQYMYMGRSEQHAGSAPLVLNLRTGNIIAQWNVVFDNWFTTVATSVEDLPDFQLDEWKNMFGYNRLQPYHFDDQDDTKKEDTLQDWKNNTDPN